MPVPVWSAARERRCDCANASSRAEASERSAGKGGTYVPHSIGSNRHAGARMECGA